MIVPMTVFDAASARWANSWGRIFTKSPVFISLDDFHPLFSYPPNMPSRDQDSDTGIILFNDDAHVAALHPDVRNL